MSNEVIVNTDDIIELKVVGDQTVETVRDMGAQAEKLIVDLRAENKPVLLLDNLMEMGDVPGEARNLVVEIGKKLEYDKLAFLGKPGILQFGSNLILHAIGKSDQLKYFDNRDDAVTWLKS